MPAMKSLACLLACIALPAAAAPAPAVRDLAVEVSLAPKKIHEECARIEAGQSRRWHWKSSAPVDFNIHYHRGDDVFYPVKRDGMRGDGGTFTAKTGEDYCWMWTAKNAPARIEGLIGK
jgi:hypothetical protein